jgi:hypothetical protein
MTVRRGARAVALVLVLGGVAGGALWLRRAAHRREVVEHFAERVTGLVRERQMLGAFALLDEANEADPQGAPLRIIRFEHQTDLGMYKLARDAMRRMPLETVVAPASAPDLTAAPPPDGAPDLVYLGAPDELFEDAAAVLGKLSIAPGPPDGLQPWQALVVSPQATAPLPAITRPTLFLGPHPQGEQRLGLVRADTWQAKDCKLVGTDAAAGALTRLGVAVPFDGEVQRYQPSTEARAVAEVRCADGQAAPAVFRSTAEPPVFAFTFDLPRLVIRLREGDPALAGQETDGVEGLRPCDLFAHTFTAEELKAPFTDLLLLSALEMAEGTGPAIRFWHQPAGATGTFIVTSDQDGSPQTLLHILEGALLEAGAAPTIFLTSGGLQGDEEGEGITAPTPEFVAQTQALGVDYSFHTMFSDDEVARPWPQMLEHHLAAVRKAYGIEPVSTRFDRVRWHGWMDPIRQLQAMHIRYDLNFLTLLSERIPTLGYMTGSGLPFRFYEADGKPLTVRELATQIDDHPHPYIKQDTPGFRQIERDALAEMTAALLTADATTFHTTIVANNHPFQFYADPDWLLDMVAQARKLGLAVYNMHQYDSWLEGLLASSWRTTGEGRYALSVRNATQDVVIRHHGGAVLVDGQPVTPRDVDRFGESVRVVTVEHGAHTLELRP